MPVCRALGGVVLALVLAVSARAHADASPNRYDRARELYGKGKAAYEAGQYETAYINFRTAYVLTQQPELLYNISSALQGLERPHDAADQLRAYLRARPEDPDKPQIEERIASLEQAQQLLDLDRKRKQEASEAAKAQAQALTTKSAATGPKPAAAKPEAAAPKAEAPPPSDAVARARNLRNVGLGIGAAGIGVVVVGVVCGVLAQNAASTVSNESATGARFDPSQERAGKTDQLVSGILYGVGGALVVTGAVITGLNWKKARADRAMVAPAIAPGRAGAVVTVRF